MKKILFITILLSTITCFSQSGKKPTQQKTSTEQPDMNKLLEDAMEDKKAFRQITQKIMQMAEEMESTPAVSNEIRQNGLQPSISSGLQSPGTFNMQKNLFK